MLETVQLNQFAALEPASQNVEQIYICHHTIVWWLHVTLQLDGQQGEVSQVTPSVKTFPTLVLGGCEDAGQVPLQGRTPEPWEEQSRETL